MKSLEEIRALKRAAERNLQRLSKVTLEGRKPPPGPYAVFYEIGNTLEKLETCQILIRRLFRDAERSILLERKIDVQTRGWPAGVPYPAHVAPLMDESRDLSVSMRTDFESLYVFGGILLDQWALVAARVGSLTVGRHPLVDLVSALENGRAEHLRALWAKPRSDLLWLHYNVRHYRNRFVVHANRPWQRGSTQVLSGIDYRLFTPTPVGWIDEALVYHEARGLLPLVGGDYPAVDTEAWGKMSLRSMIETLFDGIGTVTEREHRERIAQLYAKIGGSTPTFQVVAATLFRFIADGTERLHAIAESRLEEIDLGAPHKTSDEFERSRDVRIN